MLGLDLENISWRNIDWGVFWVHVQADTRVLIHMPSYWVPTLLFPGLFYLYFGLPHAARQASANLYMASFAAFAVVGVVAFQYGTGLAQKRDSPWEKYLRGLPVSMETRLLARGVSSLAFALPAALFPMAAALLLTPVFMTTVEWLRLALALLAGSIPFALAGIAAGYWLPTKAAIPFLNLFYVSLSYLGGLWLPPAKMPAVYARISPFTPTRMYGNLVWSAAAGTAWSWLDWLGLVLYTGLFAILVLRGYQRSLESC